MSANFSVQFRINEKTQTRVIRLTDTSSGFTLAKGNFSLTFPDGSTRIKTEWASPDITSPAAYIDILAVTDNNNNVIIGSYKIDFIALDAATTSYSASKTFDFNWVKPTNSITDLSDVIIPQVQFKDNASYSPIGSFTGTVSRVFSVPFPTTSEAAAQAATTTTTNTLTPVYTGNYYEGVYNVSNDVTCNYTHSTNSWLTINYVELFTKSVAIKKCPNQLGLIDKLNTYRGVIEAYKEKNDTQFNILSEQYDLAIALYSHIIARYETSTQDGSEGQLRELLSILEPYTGSYTYQLTKMLPFELAASGANSFNISDGVNSDSVALGSSLLFSGGNAALKPSVSNNQVDFTPIFGTTANTFAQGNDSRFHNAVTIGTSNGLSLASQVLSLAAATSSTSGAMSAADKSKLDGIAAGANTGTVTSIGISVPSAFTVSNSPVTTSGIINISATGNPLQYITGAGALATLNTGAVPESGNLYFTNTRSRSAISVSGSLSYDSGTGVISYTTPSETDPVFTASAAFGISSTNISNWNTAYGWGNHASAGYLTSSLAATTYQPLDADLTAIAGLAGTSGLLKKTASNTWSLDTNTYLTSFTETDPIFVASAAYGITNTNISNWNTAYGWGNHASAGYLTSINSSQVTTALGYTPENAASKGIANGYASLDGAGLVPSTQLPSYVDDVLEYADLASLPATGATGKIYVTLDTNKIYRWSGTVYVEISSSAGGGGTWGSIIGTLSNQTDLQSALDAKQNSLGFTPVTNARTLTINGVTYDLTANRSWTVSGTMPSGGTAGQILSKIDATDYNTQWIDNYAVQVKHEVKLGATLTKGKAVYVSTSDGTNMVVSAASNASEATSSKVIGLLETGGVTNDIVKVVTEGLLAGLDTSTATAGDPVWLGTSGNLIFGLANKPVAPAHLVFIGTVTRVQSNNGEIFVNVQNGFEIEELHNVLFTSKADKDLMYYDNATSLWKNAQLSSVLGYTPYDASNPAGYTTNLGTVTSVAALTIDSAGSDITSSVADSTTTPVITLSVPDASTIARGVVNNGTQTFGGSKTFSGNLSVINGSFSVTGNSTLTTSTGNTTVSISTGATVSGATKTINIGTSGLSGSTTNITIGSTAGTNTVTARGAWTFAGNITVASIIKSGGTSSQFLKADGSVDSSTYLTSFTETDPIYTASSWYTTTNNASNWDTAYGWGNHASAGYLTSITSSNVTTALGYTPVTNARTLTINGTTYDLTADRSWTISAGTALNGTGFVKASGTTISYDNSTYVPTNGTGATGTWGISISGNAATVSAITANTGLMTDRLTPSGFIDGLTTSNFRSTLFGTTTTAAAIATARWNTTPSVLSGLGAYGTMIAWGASDTQGFLALDYNSAIAKIGGGNGNAINWNATLLHSSNFNSYAMAGAGYSANQNLTTGSSPTFYDLYVNGWFRNNVSGQGLYNQATGNHFYSTSGNDWHIGASGGYPRLWLRNAYAGTSLLSLYSEPGYAGMLNSSSYWMVRMNNNGSGYTGGLDLFGPVGLRGIDNNVAGGMKMITHSVNKVGSSKFLKIYAGTNNYFTGFIFGYNFDNYPPDSTTNTGAGFSYQFGGWSDGSGSHGDKFFDLTHFGGNNVGNLGREMNTDGNGYIITSPTSTGAGGYKVSATIMIFARDMSKLSFTYY